MRLVRGEPSSNPASLTIDGSKMGSRVPGLRQGIGANRHKRGEAAVSYVGVCRHKTGSGTVLPHSGTGLWYSNGCASLLQCLWDPTGALESIHWSLRDLLVTAAQ